MADSNSKSRHLVGPELLSALDRFPPVDLTAELLPYARSAIADDPILQGQPLSDAQAAVRREECFAPGIGEAPPVRFLLYRPAVDVGSRAGYLHVHGGGYVLGDADGMDAANRELCAEAGCVLASVDYRLAPETVWPGAVEDCYAVLRWLHEHAGDLGIDPARIAVGGESAGGGHAAALAIMARDRGEVPVSFQFLDYPMLDDRTGSASDPDPHPHCGEFAWTPANNRFGWSAMLGMEAGTVDVPDAAAPARVADLAGLPPAYLLVGALDLFFEETLEYARRLVRAGVPVELHVIPGAFHGFMVAGPGAWQVRTAGTLRREALNRILKADRVLSFC